MATLISDAFTDTNGTALTAHTIAPTNLVAAAWTLPRGTWSILSNQAVETDLITGDNSMAVVDATVTDVGIVVDVIIPNGAAYAVGVCGRVSDASNGLLFIVERDSGGTPYMIIARRQSGSNTTIAGPTNVPGATNTTITFTVTLSGNSLTFAISGGGSAGEGPLSVSSSFNNTVTKHGLYGYGASAYITGAWGNGVITGTIATTSLDWLPPTAQPDRTPPTVVGYQT